MKINIQYGENNNIIDISGYEICNNLKYFLPQMPIDHYENHLCLIYKNVILNERKHIKFYNINENDVILFDKIENQLINDKIIVEIFMVGQIDEMIHVIVSKNQAIDQIQSIFISLFNDCNRLDLWSVNGELLTKESQLDNNDVMNGYYKIIASYGTEKESSFKYCCEVHDRYLVYLNHGLCRWLYQINKTPWLSEEIDHEMELRKYFGEIVLSIVANDERLVGVPLSNMPVVMRGCQMLYCVTIASRIFAVYKSHIQEIIEKWIEKYVDIPIHLFYHYFQFALQFATYNTITTTSSNYTSTTTFNKSLKDILSDAIFSLNTSYINDLDWFKWFNHFKLANQNYDDILDACIYKHYSHTYVLVKHWGSVLTSVEISMEKWTVSEARRVVAMEIREDYNYLYLIETGGYNQPKDYYCFLKDHMRMNDDIDDYFFEIVSQNDAIKEIKLLQEGYFSTIHLYENIVTKERFVLKIPKNGRNLYRDISIHCRIKANDKIIKYLGLYRCSDIICVALEYLPYGSLMYHIQNEKYRKEKLMKKDGETIDKYDAIDKLNDVIVFMESVLNEEEIARICYHILIQIEILHNRNIIHQDINCLNVVFDKENNAKLIDFGMSKCTELINPIELSIDSDHGTLHYVAREVIRKMSYTNMIDIWSFGILVTTMITGNCPYSQLSPTHAAMEIEKTDEMEIYKLPDFVSGELRDFVDQCLQRDPNERSNVQELFLSDFLHKYNYIS